MFRNFLLRPRALHLEHEDCCGERRADFERKALERLREALSLDPLSVAAATSLARIANRLGNASGAATAAISAVRASARSAAARAAGSAS